MGTVGADDRIIVSTIYRAIPVQLLTAELRARLPALYEQEKNDNQTVFCKFFCPWSDWTWFVTEGGPRGDNGRICGSVGDVSVRDAGQDSQTLRCRSIS